MTDDPDHRKLIDPKALDRRTGKPKKLSARVKTAIRAILNGDVKSQKEACALVGLNPSHFSEVLLSPAGRVFLERERRKTIVGGSLRAARRAVDLLDASSEHVSLDAAQFLLGVEGVKVAREPQVSLNIDYFRAGYVFRLDEDEPPTIDVTANREGCATPSEQRALGDLDEPDDQQSAGPIVNNAANRAVSAPMPGAGKRQGSSEREDDDN